MSLIGAVMLAAASYLFGAMLADCEGERLKTLDALISLLSYMRRRIYGERLPLFRIFSEYSDGHLERLGFLQIIRAKRSNISEQWASACGLLDADNDTLRELYIFGEGLGDLTLEEQIRRIDICLSVLAAAREKTAKALPQKKKSIKTVCLLVGLLTAIILL